MANNQLLRLIIEFRANRSGERQVIREKNVLSYVIFFTWNAG